MAAVLASGGVLSHESAAELWDLRRSREISVSRRSGGASHGGFRVRQVRRLPADDITVESGIPVTTVERTLVDIAGSLDEQRIERALVAASRSRASAMAGARAGDLRGSRAPGDRSAAEGREGSRSAGGSRRDRHSRSIPRPLSLFRHPASAGQRPRRRQPGRLPLASGEGHRRNRRYAYHGIAPPSRRTTIETSTSRRPATGALARPGACSTEALADSCACSTGTRGSHQLRQVMHGELDAIAVKLSSVRFV